MDRVEQGCRRRFVAVVSVISQIKQIHDATLVVTPY